MTRPRGSLPVSGSFLYADACSAIECPAKQCGYRGPNARQADIDGVVAAAARRLVR
jgi:hypothetical protein